MCPFTIAAAFGVASACASAGPSTLLDPANPRLATHHRVSGSATAGLRPFTPVDPKDWRLLNKGVMPASAGQGGMQEMPGMKGTKNMKSMPDMPGMKGMPNMPGMEMGK